MKIFLSGSSSHLALPLLSLLCADPEVEFVTGLDIKAPRFFHKKFHPNVENIDSSRLHQLMLGHDAFIHLAFVVLRGRMSEAQMRATNVNATLRAFSIAREAGIHKLINLSSAAVYGHGLELSEDALFNPIDGFLYAQQKVEVERALKRLAPEIIQFRPHIILGPHAQALLKQILRVPLYVDLPDPQPQLQAINEVDVAHAIHLALYTDCQGAFNLAPDDSMSFRDMVAHRHRFRLSLSENVANRIVNGLWEISGWGGEPAWIRGASKSLTCSNARAKQVLNWQPRYTTAEVIKSF